MTEKPSSKSGKQQANIISLFKIYGFLQPHPIYLGKTQALLFPTYKGPNDSTCVQIACHWAQEKIQN